MSHQQNIFPPDTLVVGALVSYIGGVFLLMSFSSPYWIESYDESFSSFKNMGLWEYCFKDFTYPYYQFPRLFNGCHNIFSHVSAATSFISANPFNNIFRNITLFESICCPGG